jgi:DNA invertase Pin-like site-specific DNA recombinase
MKKNGKQAVAYYVRVSAVDQNDALQRRAITAWAKANNIRQARWYADKATGTTEDRPGWRKLLAAIHAGEIGTVVVWKADRASRSLRDAAALFDDLIKRGVRLVSLTEGFDLSTPAGKAMAGMLATFAEYETSIRRERQTAGIKAARKAGKAWGGSRPGWSKLSATAQAEIRRLHAAGVSKAALARQFSVTWPTVHAVLHVTPGAKPAGKVHRQTRPTACRTR